MVEVDLEKGELSLMRLRLFSEKEIEHLSLLRRQLLSCSVLGLRWWQVSTW